MTLRIIHMPEPSRYQVLFVRRKPRMVAATYGPIRHDPGTVTVHNDYLEFEGSGVQYEGLRAARVVVPCIAFIPTALGALIFYIFIHVFRIASILTMAPFVIPIVVAVATATAYILVEYSLVKPTQVRVPFVMVRRVLLNPLRGTLLVGVGPEPRGSLTWHSFATAYAWAIFDRLEPVLEPGICSLITRRDRALARGDLSMFLAMCALTPVVGILCGLAGIGAGLLAAVMGQRRYGLVGAACCLLAIAGQIVLIQWWVTH